MKHLEKAIGLNSPIGAVYAQWMRFEEFPEFMPCVQFVRQLEGGRLEWRASLWGREIGWVAEIQQLLPEQSIAWRSVEGRALSGFVGFGRIGENRTTVTVRIDYELEGPLEWICDELLDAVGFQVAVSLFRFRDRVEAGHAPSPQLAGRSAVADGVSGS
jgi:uncharacterized membrane protein